jgi:hypothetical protein
MIACGYTTVLYSSHSTEKYDKPVSITSLHERTRKRHTAAFTLNPEQTAPDNSDRRTKKKVQSKGNE